MKRRSIFGYGEKASLIEALAWGWGVESKCLSCGSAGKMTATQLLERFHAHLDLPLENLLAGSICRRCGGALRLHTIQTTAPLPYEPSAGNFGLNTTEGLERMRERLREYAKARASASPEPLARRQAGS